MTNSIRNIFLLIMSVIIFLLLGLASYVSNNVQSNNDRLTHDETVQRIVSNLDRSKR